MSNVTSGESDPTRFVLCSKANLSELTSSLFRAVEKEIDTELDDYIVGVDLSEYSQYLLNKYSLYMPTLDYEKVEASNSRRKIPAERFPFNHIVERGKSYERPTIIFHIPFQGDEKLFHYHTGVIYGAPEVFVSDGCLCLELVDFNNDLERIGQDRQTCELHIKRALNPLEAAVDQFNYSLAHNIENRLRIRKQKIEDIVRVLGVPIKRRENLTGSYTIPSMIDVKKNISLKPFANEEQGNAVEYVLGDDIYSEILQVIHDYGIGFEQYPSIARGDEEEIRNHFLFVLQPRYNWLAAGEAFNKLGKTDLLIRHQNGIVFIAEFKFWRGRRVYLDTISQLFDRYLTWRNSKAAVVILVKNKDFSAVIEEVRNATNDHPNFVRFEGEREETWLNFTFHVNDSPTRGVKLAVLLFHVPDSSKMKLMMSRKSDKTNK